MTIVRDPAAALLTLRDVSTSLERDPDSSDDPGVARPELVAEVHLPDAGTFETGSTITEGEQPSLTAPFSILVVDDDTSILTMMTAILRSEGYRVRAAVNGAEGLAALETQPSALVLLDMRMPVLNGWGFARALRDRGDRTPIIVMTAAQDAHRWAQEIGAAAVLAKPFDVDDLLALVERFSADQN